MRDSKRASVEYCHSRGKKKTQKERNDNKIDYDDGYYGRGNRTGLSAKNQVAKNEETFSEDDGGS